MKSEVNSSVGKFLIPSAPQELFAFGAPKQNQHAGSFTEYLRSAETKRSHAKTSTKADATIRSTKEATSSAACNHSGKSAKHTKQMGLAKPARHPILAHKILMPRDTKSATETETAKPDSTKAAIPSKAEKESSQDTEALEAASVNQAMFATAFVAVTPPILQPLAKQQAATGEVIPAIASSSEPLEVSKEDLWTKQESVDEKNMPTSGSELKEQVKPDEQQRAPTSDSGESGQSESQTPSREGKPHLGALPRFPTDHAGQADGTAAAKQMLPMTNTVEMEKSAEPAMKNLPGTEGVVEVTTAPSLSRVEGLHDVRRDFQVDAAVSHFSDTNTLSNGIATQTDSTKPAADVPAVERSVRAVIEGIVQMRHMGTESVSVVLKPDGGTELLLRVEMRDGALHAQMHFERGDRGSLDLHWDELQRRLAEQGVQLSRGDDASMSGNEQFAQSQRRHSTPDNDSASNISSTFTKKSSNNETITRRSARGFETWA